MSGIGLDELLEPNHNQIRQRGGRVLTVGPILSFPA
jgi:hypothetical protein